MYVSDERGHVPRRKPLPKTAEASYEQVRDEDASHHQEFSDVSESNSMLHAHRRRRTLAWSILDFAGDFVLCLAPVSFVILAACAISLDGKEVSDFGNHVHSWALLSPTIFPLIFAAVVGRSLKHCARYRLERGGTLGALEQLTGSQNVFGAIWIQMVLRSFNVLGVLLALLWLISPLGGQASLRIIDQVPTKINGQQDLAVIKMTEAQDPFFQAMSTSSVLSTVYALFVGTLVEPMTIKNGPQDTWNNIKIPHYETYKESLDADGRATIPEDDVDWVSLIGVPVAGLKTGMVFTFTLPVWYQDMDCADVHKVPTKSDWLKHTFGNNSRYDKSSIWGSDGEMSWRLIALDMDGRVDQSEPTVRTSNVMWASKCGKKLETKPRYTAESVCLSNCTIGETFVEMTVDCHGRSCRTTKLRKLKPPSGDDAPLRQPLPRDSMRWTNFESSLTRGGYFGDTQTSSVVEHYIYGHVESPYMSLTSSEFFSSFLDMTDVKREDFSQRLRRIYNGYYIASLAPYASLGAMSQANAEHLLTGKDNLTTSVLTERLPFVAAKATTSTSAKVHSCNMAFAALVILSSLIMFAVAVLGVAAKYCCRRPDVLGYVSSIVRHNPYTQMEPYDPSLDTSDLARAWRRTVVRLDEVGEKSGNGARHVVMASSGG